jgi:NADPH2:quinone reductase
MVNFLRDRAEVLAKAADVWRGFSQGWLRPAAVRSFALGDAASAHRALEDRSSVGKLTLTIEHD